MLSIRHPPFRRTLLNALSSQRREDHLFDLQQILHFFQADFCNIRKYLEYHKENHKGKFDDMCSAHFRHKDLLFGEEVKTKILNFIK